MANVTDYAIIESDNHAELVEAVGNMLREGWVPQGGLVIWREPGEEGGVVSHSTPPIVHYAQALVKYG